MPSPSNSYVVASCLALGVFKSIRNHRFDQVRHASIGLATRQQTLLDDPVASAVDDYVGTSGSCRNGSCSPYPGSYRPAVMISGERESFAL
jgi:hypothetical protein